MTAHTRFRIAAAIGALIVPLALVATASGPAGADADGKHRHDLNTYKREAWHEILSSPSANSIDVSMSCDPGDYALDGMWKVDAHDGDMRSIRADASRRMFPAKDTWQFILVNTGSGRAQVKTFVTCLDATTGARDGHTHQIQEGQLQDATATTQVVAGQTETTLTASCQADEIPVAPSFALTGGSTTRLVKSYPTGVGLIGWEWKFYGAPGGGVVAAIYCLERQTSTADGHSHRIDADLLPIPAPNTHGVDYTVPKVTYTDYRITSRPHDEGNVGAFVIWHYDVYYLGQDAQGQVRGFRFANPAGAGSEQVTLAVWGFDKRTTKNS